MLRAVSLCAAALLAGCSPASPSLPIEQSSDIPPPAVGGSIVEPWTMEGEYLVTHVGQQPPVIGIEGYDPIVTIGPKRIRFESQCIFADWTYRGAGESYAARRFYEADNEMCERMQAPGEVAIQDAITSMTAIRRIHGGLLLEGGEQNLQLRRVISDEARAERAVDLTGEWRVAGLDGEPIDGPYAIAISADFRDVWWEPACAGQGREYAVLGNRFETLPPEEGPQIVCSIGYPDELPRIWAAMDAADRIERTPENAVLISGGGRSVTLFSQ